MRVISLSNEKGGVGKTATVHNLGAALAEMGNKVLLVDMDPQGTLTKSCGIETTGDDQTTYEVLRGADINNAIKTLRNYDLLPADRRLTRAIVGTDLIEQPRTILKDALGRATGAYDYVLIDSGPSLNILSVVALAAAQRVLIPVSPDSTSLWGLEQIRDTIEDMGQLNPDLDITGAVFTRFSPTRKDDTEIYQTVLNMLGKRRIMRTTISTGLAIRRAPGKGKDVLQYSPRSKSAAEFRALAAEVVEKIPATNRKGTRRKKPT